jgi:hypothetical protein
MSLIKPSWSQHPDYRPYDPDLQWQRKTDWEANIPLAADVTPIANIAVPQPTEWYLRYLTRESMPRLWSSHLLDRIRSAFSTVFREIVAADLAEAKLDIDNVITTPVDFNLSRYTANTGANTWHWEGPDLRAIKYTAALIGPTTLFANGNFTQQDGEYHGNLLDQAQVTDYYSSPSATVMRSDAISVHTAPPVSTAESRLFMHMAVIPITSRS